MTTVTFDNVLTQLLRRAGIDMEDSPDLTQYPDLAALLNLRLRECWEYTQWDALRTVGTQTFATETYRTIDLSDGKLVLGVYAQDPRESEMVVSLRTSILEAGKLRLESDCPNQVWYDYLPGAPDWVADAPVPTVFEMFRPAAVELAYADQLEQDGQHDKSRLVSARGYRLLDELANRQAFMNTQPRVSVGTNPRSLGYNRRR